MKAMLVLQEGPGAGRSYPLDPDRQPVLSVGRSGDCAIVLDDHRASRHHADFSWNGRQWEVVDRGSTNGTYVNGMQVHGPYDLRVGDRVTIGETTFVLREPSARAAAPPAQPARAQPQPGPRQPAAAVAPREPAATAVNPAFWLIAAVIAAAVVCLASGAFLPWLQVTGSLSQDLAPLIQGATNFISSIFGSDSLFHVTQDVGGLEGYGKLTLAVAVVSAVALAVDLFVARKTMAPAIVYLLTGLIATGAMASDLVSFYRLYKQVESWSLLFGIQLGQVVQFLDRFIEMKVTPLIGLQLTVVGLALLLLGGAGRLILALVGRGRRA
jgi:pSer/pThr/pTyr-binding forkhead associated (FHA) protein